MSTMTTLETLWQQLRAGVSSGGGLLYRRYVGITPDVYAGLRGSEQVLAIAIKPPFTDTLSGSFQLHDIQTELVTDPLQPHRQLLLLVLTNRALTDLFAVLGEDLVQQIARETNQEKLVEVLFNRLERWRALFESYAPDGLSAEAQRGLFGELYFLRTLLEADINPIRIMTAWVGPARASHDYEFAEVAIEVKTSIAFSPQSFQVSNARHLDDTGLNNLYVLFLSLNSLPDQGETLNQLIDDVTGTLSVEPAQLNQFRLRLYEAGYFPDHRLRYDQPGYQVLVTSYFRVGAGFPRLREADVPVGVGELRYSVSLAACDPFSVTQQEILRQLTT